MILIHDSPPLSLTCNSKVPCVFQFKLPLLPLLPLPLQTIEMNLSKAKSNGGRPATTSDDQFPVSQYMADDVELPWGHLDCRGDTWQLMWRSSTDKFAS